MSVIYKDIDELSQKSSVAGTEKIVVSDTEYITPAQIAGDTEKFFFVQGSSSSAGNSTSGEYLSTKWEGTVPGITTPVNGMKIAYRIATNTGVATAGAVLSIDGGTTYKPVVFNVNSVITTRYSVGSTLLLVYNSTQTANGYLTSNKKSTITGCWQIMDYSASNTDTKVRQYQSGDNAAGTAPEYPILGRYAVTNVDGTYEANYARFHTGVTLNTSTGALTATSFKKTGGSSSQFLKADGSVDSNTYATTSQIPSVPVTDVTVGGSSVVSSGTAVIPAIPSAPGTLNTNNTTAQSVSSSEALSGTINLHKVAKTGTYSDLIGTPTIPSAPGSLVTNATTAQTASSGEAMSSTITLHKVAKTGTYSDLIGKPTIPSAPGTLNTTATTAQSTNASEALSGSVTLHKIAKTGSYSDLIGTPSVDNEISTDSQHALQNDVITKNFLRGRNCEPLSTVTNKYYSSSGSEVSKNFCGYKIFSVTAGVYYAVSTALLSGVDAGVMPAIVWRNSSENVISCSEQQNTKFAEIEFYDVIVKAPTGASTAVVNYDCASRTWTGTLKIVSGPSSDCELNTNKVTSISSSSTNTQYPSAKCVYDIVGNIEALLTALL